MSRSRGRRTELWRGGIAVVAFALALPSCRFVGTRAHNLTELHDDVGRHKRSGALLSDFQYAWLMGIAAAVPGVESREGTIKKIPKPLEACVRNLDALNSFSSTDPRTAAVQVRLLAWLAVDDPWKLSRERAVLGLGVHGQRLKVALVPDAQEAPADVEVVRDAIARLVSAMRSTLDPKEADPDAPEADIAAACQHIDGLTLDRGGAVRLLRAASVLEAQVSKRDERFAPLRSTIVRLQHVCVRQALREALLDRPPRAVGGSHPGWNSELVRAAATSACVRAFGDPALGEMLLTLDRELSPLVVTAMLHQVRRRGLPAAPVELPEDEREQLRERWIQLIMLQAAEHPSGTVRVAAMRALEAISGGELHSLREEDWQAWMRARRQAAEPEPEPADDEPPPDGTDPR